MAEANPRTAAEDMLDVRRAAALVGRHPETVRRWVWSGRLAARKQGNRLLMARADVEALAKSEGRAVTSSLAAWADRARAARAAAGANGSGRSAADLVIEDRGRRSRAVDAGAGR
jgi:excisionase family DNA binding protein